MDTFGLRPLPWSRAAGISPSAIYNFLNGRAESLSQPTMEALARAVGRQVSEITGETVAELTPSPVRQVHVQGAVAAGNFRDSSEWAPDGQFTIKVPLTAPGMNFFGLAVDGEDMNQVYPSGSVLVCSPLKKLRRRLKSGDRVIVERRASNGQIESTVREIQFDNEGRTWLWPRSDRPQHQQPAEVYWPPDLAPDESDRETREVTIVAIVVSSYQPEA
jgi:SOS-response transcriptional repressor LexA